MSLLLATSSDKTPGLETHRFPLRDNSASPTPTAAAPPQRNATQRRPRGREQHRRSRLTKGRRTPSTPRHGDVVPSPGAQRPRVARPRLRAKGVSRAEPGEPDTRAGARRHIGPGGRITFFFKTPPVPRSAPAPSPGTRPRVRVRAASETREGTCFLVLAAACMVVVAEHVRPRCPKCACLHGPALSCLFWPRRADDCPSWSSPYACRA